MMTIAIRENDPNYTPLHSHIGFYNSLFGSGMKSVCRRLVNKGYVIECFPGHCEKPLDHILAVLNYNQRIKVHTDYLDEVFMVELKEMYDDGFLFYRKLTQDKYGNAQIFAR